MSDANAHLRALNAGALLGETGPHENRLRKPAPMPQQEPVGEDDCRAVGRKLFFCVVKTSSSGSSFAFCTAPIIAPMPWYHTAGNVRLYCSEYQFWQCSKESKALSIRIRAQELLVKISSCCMMRGHRRPVRSCHTIPLTSYPCSFNTNPKKCACTHCVGLGSRSAWKRASSIIPCRREQGRMVRGNEERMRKRFKRCHKLPFNPTQFVTFVGIG
jgi:hypothetical protein